jgi:hypothetical protein
VYILFFGKHNERLIIQAMKRSIYLNLLILLIPLYNECTFYKNGRDPLKQPFSKYSIWNLPIHKDAVYRPALISPPTGAGLLTDEDFIILSPDAPLTTVYANYTGWSHYKNRCVKEGHLLFEAPIPNDFIVSRKNWLGENPNANIAILMPDGITIRQTQPFARCEIGEYATSRYVWPDVNIYGDGIIGAHGGSGLSGIGGTIRLGELIPGGEIRHCLKINVYGAKYLYYSDSTQGKRWPAPVSDGYSADLYGKEGKPEYECRMGALLALKPDLKLNTLEFETGKNGPAMILAKALQLYGGYIVDDTYWDVLAITTEHSPEGRVIDEFEKKWGYPFETGSDTPFGRDMAKIIKNLNVIINNSPETIGGGPTEDLANRLAPPAGDLRNAPEEYAGSILDQFDAPTAVSINPRKLELAVGQSYQLFAGISPNLAAKISLKWDSENPDVVIVNAEGLLEAKAEGIANIMVSTIDGRLKDICQVLVSNKNQKKSEVKKEYDPLYTKSLKHQIGEFFQGGIIFHIWADSTGIEHGLIASLIDLSSPEGIKWGGNENTGAVSLDNGMNNTQLIVNALGTTGNYAALLCFNADEEGYKDWYLPSIKELNLLWQQKDLINDLVNNDNNVKTIELASGTYWSSTEASEKDAYMEYFPNDYLGYYQKIFTYRVRAIRKF